MFKSYKSNSTPFCTKCGREFESKEAFKNIKNPVCGVCREKEDSLFYDSVISLGEYDGVLKEMIHLYKYNKRERLNKVLGFLLLQKIKNSTLTLNTDILIPVPLYWLRKRLRGFNQSEELARFLSKGLGIPVATLLSRRKNTKPQVFLSVSERIKNVRNAFSINWLTQKVEMPFMSGLHSIKGKSIILIDDVVTTGATVNECSKVLKKLGAREVNVVCLAIAC